LQAFASHTQEQELLFNLRCSRLQAAPPDGSPFYTAVLSPQAHLQLPDGLVAALDILEAFHALLGQVLLQMGEGDREGK
jgi:hypothetical protein